MNNGAMSHEQCVRYDPTSTKFTIDHKSLCTNKI